MLAQGDLIIASSSGLARRSSRVASSLATLAEEEALHPAAVMEAVTLSQENVTVSNRGGIKRLSVPDWNSVDYITESNPRWMEIYAVIGAQLDTHGFNFGPTQDISAVLRRAYNDSTLSSEVIASLDAKGFVWSSVGAILSCSFSFCVIHLTHCPHFCFIHLRK